MKDLSRIVEENNPNKQKAINLIRSLVLSHPEQRIGQVILNACREFPGWPDIFDIEDDELVQALEKELSK